MTLSVELVSLFLRLLLLSYTDLITLLVLVVLVVFLGSSLLFATAHSAGVSFVLVVRAVLLSVAR